MKWQAMVSGAAVAASVSSASILMGSGAASIARWRASTDGIQSDSAGTGSLTRRGSIIGTCALKSSLAHASTSTPAERWRDVSQDRFHDMRVVIHTELVGDS